MAILPETSRQESRMTLRLAMHTLVRRGFEAEDFVKLARVFKEIILDNCDPNLVRLRYVFDLAERNKECLFSFDLAVCNIKFPL